MDPRKSELLKKIASRIPMRSVPMSKSLAGSTPPSVFIGSFGYPKVLVGPLVPPVCGDTRMLDSPEQWIPSGLETADVLGYRMQLIRGKQAVNVKETQGRMGEMLQDISLSRKSANVEASFKKAPRGFSLSEELPAFGPSGELENLRVDAGSWDARLEKAFYDTDLRAREAVLELYGHGAEFSEIQRAFSVGAFGLERNRKLVPTKWSITAVDSTLANELREQVMHTPMLETNLVYEFQSFANKYCVVFYPSVWQFEWIEAFFEHAPEAKRASIFGDFEYAEGKKEYSRVGGCYYSSKLAALEKLSELGRQAGVLILREAYPEYVPTGVWNVRENIRNALKQAPAEFETSGEALKHAFSRMKIPESDWRRNSDTLKNNLRQQTLSAFYF